MKKLLLAGNWKMHKNIAETLDFLNDLKGFLKESGADKSVDSLIAPQFLALTDAIKATKDSPVKIASQNIHWEESGAYTGELSPDMLKDINCTSCIIGHSERRQYFGETDQTVNQRVKNALKHQIMPIICVGELLEDREAGKTQEVVKRQVEGALEGISADDFSFADCIIAYEPVWAIGTGKTASPEDAQEVHQAIRNWLTDLYSAEFSNKTLILYGGSVKPANVLDLMSKEDIDGALIGGASLKVDSFTEMLKICSQ